MATFYVSPGTKGHPHKWEILDLAKVISQGCPSHAVMPRRHRMGNYARNVILPSLNTEKIGHWHRPAWSWFQPTEELQKVGSPSPHRWDCRLPVAFLFLEELGWAVAGINGRGVVIERSQGDPTCKQVNLPFCLLTPLLFLCTLRWALHHAFRRTD